MTPKQQRFVDEYLIDLNATAAYRRAGYEATGNSAEVNAARLLRNAQVASAIEQGKLKRAQETGVTAAWVLLEAKRVYDRATDLDKLPEALKALELCGKHVDVGAFKDRVEHSGGVALIVSNEDAGL